METFTLTLSTGTVAFDGTTFTATATDGTVTTYSNAPASTPATVVDVTEGENIQIEETDAATPAA